MLLVCVPRVRVRGCWYCVSRFGICVVGLGQLVYVLATGVVGAATLARLSWWVLQSVTMVGATKRHASEASIIESKSSHRYHVVKINTSGFKQKRILTVDAETSSLWNFNRKMRLKKQVPLSQLVQVRRVCGRSGWGGAGVSGARFHVARSARRIAVLSAEFVVRSQSVTCDEVARRHAAASVRSLLWLVRGWRLSRSRVTVWVVARDCRPSCRQEHLMLSGGWTAPGGGESD